jgi:hypothetical protein
MVTGIEIGILNDIYDRAAVGPGKNRAHVVDFEVRELTLDRSKNDRPLARLFEYEVNGVLGHHTRNDRAYDDSLGKTGAPLVRAVKWISNPGGARCGDDA